MTGQILAAYHTPGVLIAVALQLLDVLSTLIVLRGRGGYESNPVVAGLIDVLGPLWPVGKVAITTAAIVAFALSPWPWMVWVLNAAGAWVVWHNIGVIQRQRNRRKRDD